MEWVCPTATKEPILDLQKQKETFLQVKEDLCDQGASSSRSENTREPATILLRSNPCIEEVQHQVNMKTYEESEPSGLMKSFIHSCLHLLRDEKAILEIQKLIDNYDQSMSVVVA